MCHTCLSRAIKNIIYVKENITINSDWESLSYNNKEHKQQDTKEDIDVDETLAEYNEESITKSLLHWFNDAHSVKYFDTTTI